MLVILTEEHVLSTRQVCQNCLLATHQGQPRWQAGKLGCGRSLHQVGSHQLPLYECKMGFRVANIEG